MIKTFEQFVSAKYDNPVNEAFQSSKLREIIKQHGMPKYSFENKMLYDLKDNEIIDVLSSDEYFSKYSSYKKGEEAVFSILLKDGYRVVISNLGIWNDFRSEREKDKVFNKRYSERHKGEKYDRFGDIGYDQKQHQKNVENILRRRLVEKLQAVNKHSAAITAKRIQNRFFINLPPQCIEVCSHIHRENFH